MSGVPSYMPKAKVYCDFFKATGVHTGTGCKGHVPPFNFFFLLWKYKYKKNKTVSIRTYVNDNIMCALNV